jgi:hypothetical protein
LRYSTVAGGKVLDISAGKRKKVSHGGLRDTEKREEQHFIVCLKCNGHHFALVGYRDRRKFHKDMALPVIFGRTSTGEIVIRDLARSPHLLIGDTLFKDGDSEAIRLQVPYIRDEEVKQIVDSAIAQYPGREFIAGRLL